MQVGYSASRPSSETIKSGHLGIFKMNEQSWKLAENLIPSTYVRQAHDASNSRDNTIQHFLQHRKLPENGWDDMIIEMLLSKLSSMDSNNFPHNCGVGEREARCASNIVAKRNFYFGHGVGRSGELTEPQPKAAGSSLLFKLGNCLVEDLMKEMGIDVPLHCSLVPVATGMSLVISMLSLRHTRPEAKYVIWSRIDQKSCFKSIISAGFIPIIIDVVQSDEQLVTNKILMEEKLIQIGSESILCIMTTTSCFAPRACDDLDFVSGLCEKYNIPHVINNAYGLQSHFIMKKIARAHKKGRVDIFVQSTDKNLLVPVGGAIISCFNKSILDNIVKTYPGRASSSPIIDVFITLLSLGKNGYLKIVEERNKMYDYLHEKLLLLAESVGETVLNLPDNPISIAMTLKNVPKANLTQIGSMLFLRNVSGVRVVSTLETKTISGYTFSKWGSHSSSFNCPYFTAAASLGMTQNDVDLFIKRLHKIIGKHSDLFLSKSNVTS